MAAWIPELVDYWIVRCDIKNKKQSMTSHDIHAINTIFPHNFCLLKGTFLSTKFILEYEKMVETNIEAIPRINLYDAFFNRVRLYPFTFVFTHLDIFITTSFFDNLKIICFAPSTFHNDTVCIPIVDPYNFWEDKRNTVYNVNYDMHFNNTPFHEKQNKVAWRGQNVPTFTRFGLQTLRNNVVEKWNTNIHFDIGYTPFFDYYKFTSFKYILNIDGYGASFDGTIWKLRSSSLVIWITDDSSNMYCMQW